MSRAVHSQLDADSTDKLWLGLCIGGPLDGQIKAARSVFLQVANPLPASCVVPEQSSPGSDSSEVPSVTTYGQLNFHTPQQTFRFWVPEGTTPAEVMERLIGSYKPKSEAA